ncbi:MAG: ABC transporter ATP-binding protein [Chloroflexota bacterium]
MSVSGQTVIEAVNLTKKYNGFTAVDRLNLEVRQGEVFGFLGPNGAGKTTTILMLLGLTEPTSGMARVLGYNATREPLRVKSVAGYLPESLGLYEDMTAKQNLHYIASLNNLPKAEAVRRISELLALVGLPEVADRRVATFSKGMKQRLGIACVLIKEPKVVFLDEPTSGLDPDGARFMSELIVKMSQERGMTVILSSHLLHQVQRICHRVGIMSKGRLVAEGSVEELGRKMTSSGGQFTVEVETTGDQQRLNDALWQLKGVTKIEPDGNRLLITCTTDLRPQIAKVVLDSSSSLLRLEMRGPAPLEEIYMKYFREE